MKTTTLMIVLVAAFAFALVGCKKGGGGATPEDAVKGMMDAAIAKNWEKAVSYVDVEGIVETMKKQMAGMSEEAKKEMEKTMGDMLDVKKVKAKMIEDMKKDENAVTSYKIIETKSKTDKSVVFVVETVEGKKTKTSDITVVKVGNVWKMGAPEMPAIEPSVIETPVIEEKGKEEIPTNIETTTEETKVEEGKDKEPKKDEEK
jgi:hypothetical protein